MNLVAHSISSKGGAAFVRRLGTVATRFSLSPHKVERYLDAYLEVLGQSGANATFPITAVVLDRHHAVARRLASEGVEFAVHGYVHTDHSRLSSKVQQDQFARAIEVFRSRGIPAVGFRSPYLRYNNGTVQAITNLGFRYVSNETRSFDVLDPSDFAPDRWNEYERALRLYQSQPVARAQSRPTLRGGLVHIPVSMPDDEILVDRLDVTDPVRVGQTWSVMLDICHVNDDLLTLQLHPERGEICRRALAMVLSQAKMKTPSVWIAQLRDIDSWWRNRASQNLVIERADDQTWRIVKPSSDLTVVARNLTAPGLQRWYENEFLLPEIVSVVSSDRRPVIGVSPASVELESFLVEEGYIVARGIDRTDCAAYFDRPGQLLPGAATAVAADLARSNAPLVRISRWPGGARSCLAITGDIDALTLGDFLSRTWEVA